MIDNNPSIDPILVKESNEENSFLIEIEETSCRNLENRRKKFSIEITIYKCLEILRARISK